MEVGSELNEVLTFNKTLSDVGGAFVIPYIIVLFLVGKPVYYLEMVIGQFSSRSSIKAFDLCPITRGMCSRMIKMQPN